MAAGGRCVGAARAGGAVGELRGVGPCTGGHRGVDSVGLSPGCPRYRLRGLPGGGASPRRRCLSAEAVAERAAAGDGDRRQPLRCARARPHPAAPGRRVTSQHGELQRGVSVGGYSEAGKTSLNSLACFQRLARSLPCRRKRNISTMVSGFNSPGLSSRRPRLRCARVTIRRERLPRGV